MGHVDDWELLRVRALAERFFGQKLAQQRRRRRWGVLASIAACAIVAVGVFLQL